MAYGALHTTTTSLVSGEATQTRGKSVLETLTTGVDGTVGCDVPTAALAKEGAGDTTDDMTSLGEDGRFNDDQCPYVDHSKDPINKDTPHSGVFARSLYNLLRMSKKEGFEDVLAWQDHGRAFKINDRQAFFNDIAPRYVQTVRRILLESLNPKFAGTFSVSGRLFRIRSRGNCARGDLRVFVLESTEAATTMSTSSGGDRIYSH